MVHSNLKPCCYKCDTPMIETERFENGLPGNVSYIIYCEHACVCKHYLASPYAHLFHEQEEQKND